MAEQLAYHWKHGWIPLTHAAALSKAHGNSKAADRLVPGAGRHGDHATAGKSARQVHAGLGQHAKIQARPMAHQGVAGHNITGTDTKGRKVGVFVPGDRHAAQRAIDNIHSGRPAFEGHTSSVSPLAGKQAERAAQSPREIHDRLMADPRKVSMDELQRLSRTGGKFAPAANAEIGRRDDAEMRDKGITGLAGAPVVPPSYGAGPIAHHAKALQEQQKASRLRAAADAKRAEAERVANGVGFGDRAAGRLGPPGLRQFNRNIDSSLRRYTAARGQAENLDHKATLAEGRARSATEKAQDAARGAAGTFGQHNIKPGDIVKRRGETHIVQRANAKTVSVPHYEPRLADAGYTDTFSYSQITEHRSIDSASSETLQKLLASKRSSPAVKSRVRQILASRGIAN